MVVTVNNSKKIFDYLYESRDGDIIDFELFPNNDLRITLSVLPIISHPDLRKNCFVSEIIWGFVLKEKLPEVKEVTFYILNVSSLILNEAPMSVETLEVNKENALNLNGISISNSFDSFEVEFINQRYLFRFNDQTYDLQVSCEDYFFKEN